MIKHFRPAFGAVVQAMRFLGPYRKKYYLGLVLSLLELLVLFAVPFFNRQAVLAISSASWSAGISCPQLLQKGRLF